MLYLAGGRNRKRKGDLTGLTKGEGAQDVSRGIVFLAAVRDNPGSARGTPSPPSATSSTYLCEAGGGTKCRLNWKVPSSASSGKVYLGKVCTQPTQSDEAHEEIGYVDRLIIISSESI